jgi:hypothetical protein
MKFKMDQCKERGQLREAATVNFYEKKSHYDGDKLGPRADLALVFTLLFVLGVMVLIIFR